MTDGERKAFRLAQSRKANAKWRAAHKAEERMRHSAYRAGLGAETLRQRNKASHERHRDTRLAYGAVYRAERRITTRAKAKAKRLRNLADMRARDKTYRLAHKEKVRQSKATYRATSQEIERAYRRQYYAVTKDLLANKHLAWARANRGLVNSINMRWWAARLKATPPWANQASIRAVYDEAVRLTEATGIRHDVDHIVPLQSSTVCGLHVACNLQVLTKSDNSRKHNKFMPHIGLTQLPCDEAPRRTCP